MMGIELFLTRKKSGVDAKALYDVDAKSFVVLKGSKVSENIAHSEKFRGANSIEEARKGIIKDGKLTEDVTFKSASTAANFVTGASTNGLVTWKNKEGVALKQLLAER